MDTTTADDGTANLCVVKCVVKVNIENSLNRQVIHG